MSIATINVSHDGWISEYGPDTELSGDKLYTASIYKDIGNTSNVTAYLQFEIPQSVIFKKITRATLHYHFEDERVHGGIDVAYNPYLIGSLDSVTYNTVRHYTIGEPKVVNRRLAGEQWIAEDLTDIFQNNVVNNIFAVLVSCGLSATPTRNASYIGGKSGSNAAYMTVEYEDVEQLPPTISYPAGVYVREGEPVTFSWAYNSLTQATQESATIQWRLKGEEWNTINVDAAAHYYIYDGALPQGIIEWKVCVKNSIGETSVYSEVAEFTVQGKPAMPVIMDVENKCLPCIKWNAADQCAFDIEISSGDAKLIQETVYSGDSEYRPQIFMNGTYTVSVRTRNSIDLWSDKASKTFVINPPEPDAPTVEIRQEGAKVILEIEHEEGTLLAIIRNEKIIAVTDASVFEDRTVLSEEEYEYKVRAFDEGYADSVKVSAMVSYPGFILSGSGEEVNCTVSEQKFIGLSMQREQEAELIRYDGREYPVLEVGTSRSEVLTRTVTVTDEEYEKIQKISERPAFYRDKEGHAFTCAVSVGTTNRYMGERYSVALTMTRVDEEEVLLNE